jgi:DNA polymerase-3 subunit epsilon
MPTIWAELRRRWRARRVAAGRAPPLALALARRWSGAAPATRFLALDLETSALDPRAGEILALGWVAVDGDRIPLASARRLLVAGPGPVGTSATIHGIRDEDRDRAGLPLRRALLALARAQRDRTLLFFHAPFDLAFLDAAWRSHFHTPFLAPRRDVRVDALARLAHRGIPLEGRGGSLPALRARFSLPPHRAHDALDDALATAELFLALRR